MHSPQAPGAAPEAAKEPDVPATEAVITIHNLCAQPEKKEAKPTMQKSAQGSSSPSTPKNAAGQTDAASCTKVVTRADFEKMLDSFHPQGPVPAGQKQNLARAYVEWRVMENAALNENLETDPQFQEMMRILRMRVLADAYRRHLDDQLRHTPDSDLQAYYQAHISKFEQVSVRRMVIPKVNPTAPKDDQYSGKAQAAATDVHDRIAKGEDPDAVMKDEYTKLGITSPPMKTDLGMRRRGTLGPQGDAIVFAMNAGDVSAVQTEPSGYVIYKVDSKDTLPFDKAKEEVTKEYVKEKLDEQMKAVSESAQPDYNSNYFGTMVPQVPAGAMRAAPAARPPQQ